MTTAETLRAARELIADPEHWTQGCLARNKDGQPALYDGRSACSWFAIGAIRRTADDPYPAMEALDRAAGASRLYMVGHAAAVNDTRDHAAVMDMFDRAIEEAEGD